MATFHCRTAFISDVHMGTPDCKAAYLLHFLRRRSSGRQKGQPHVAKFMGCRNVRCRQQVSGPT